MTGVGSNSTVWKPSLLLGLVSFSGMLLSAVRSFGTSSETEKVAFRFGSSKQGKARRASHDSNWVLNI